MPLYTTEDGTLVSTHSMLKTFRRCPKQTQFKYVDRLKPRLPAKPMSRGVWLHYLLEAYHKGEDWLAVHKRLSNKFNNMFDEEKDFYGDMPTECYNIMLSYIWHYANDPWKVLDTEFVLETELPDGTVYRCRIDALVETLHGLYLVDHKSHRTLPDHNFRLLDGQSALYIWCALRNRIPVEGFIWNYIRTKPPAKPVMVKSENRLSRRRAETDYPTYVRELQHLRRTAGLRITKEYVDYANQLKSHRYTFGEPQKSPFFRRYILEKQPDMLRRVATENFHTSRRMHSYDFGSRDSVERVVERSCTYNCSFVDICTIELLGGNIRPLIRQNYTTGDPLDYYNDNDSAYQKGEA